MPILYSTITQQLASALDSEDSQRYTDNEDFIPAINYAIDYVTLAFNSIFSQKKLSEEVLKELTYVKVWTASTLSRIAFDSTKVGMELWSILAVYPKCSTIGGGTVVPTKESVYMPTLSFTDGNYVAKRLTLEEWTERNRNVFSAGSPLINCSELIEYGYINFANYTGGYTLSNNPFEIGISPSVSGQKVAIAFLKKPTKVSTTADSIEFPDVLLNLFVATSLKFLSIKQNNKNTLMQVSMMDTESIIKMLS